MGSVVCFSFFVNWFCVVLFFVVGVVGVEELNEVLTDLLRNKKTVSYYFG